MNAEYRVAITGFAHESCTFSPLPICMDDLNIWRGEDLRGQYPFLSDYPDVHWVPLVRARAVPGGPVLREVYDAIKAEALEGLRASGPWDAVYLDMHGAMFVQGMQNAEADWTAAVRAVIGPDCLIAASYDLHGNLSPEIVAQIDLMTAYRTAPHIDGLETRARAVRLLVQCLREGLRPHKAYVSIPVDLPGERTMTIVEPGRSVYARIPEVAARPDVLDASILVGYVWADEPRSHSSAFAIGRTEEAAQAAAKDLARVYWDARFGFNFGMPTGSVDECIQMALASPEPAVFISDAGDNPTGGGVGDVPFVLERLLAHNVPSAAMYNIADPEAIGICAQAGQGVRVRLTLGGKLDPVNGSPLPVEGTVLRISGEAPERRVVLQVGGVKVVVTERREGTAGVDYLTSLGIDPTAHQIVVVKLGYLHPDLYEVASRHLLAFSPGAINPQVEVLPYQHIQRPMYPFDPEMTWEV